ncbi:uncharacterized protein Tco025E_09756 [Trypanosoma conorhini]|uniref:NAA35-like TPR repeats domain-containing protein n=1 Tax=Trypanosoma conorhini TaxID=83891 RepID=A0A422MT00_9TRYP|nr:uncharacterized protein Tco025E_09756 [Trypanosoma conorhini]RNE96342.1 hypothetical protein Tco025E_09756 [Trypanosoma conorhini]
MTCNLDDTWVECMGEFKELLAENGVPWRCYTCDGVDKEAMLSAPEVMDAKTDPGCGYGSVRSLNSLLKDGTIPSAATLGGAALLDVMDLIHVKELQYLQGFSLTAGCLAFAYFFRLDLLEQQNPTLHAYCRGVARCIELTTRVVMTTRVRSDEEFIPWLKPLEPVEEVTEAQIMQQLEEAAGKAESPAIAARLRWRKLLLSILSAFVLGSKKSEAEEACDLCREACDLLGAAEFQREAEPVPDGRFFREAEVVYWASSFTPTKPQPCAPFAEAMQAYKVFLSQIASLKNLFTMPSLQEVLEFVEALGARKPLLPMRAITIVLLFRHDPSESFLHGPSLLQRVLQELADEHGAPLYLKIFNGDEEVLEAVVKYRIQKTMDAHKIAPDQPMLLRQQTVEAVRSWAVEMSKAYLVHLEAVMCNRGLAHRRLMNALPHLGSLQEVSYSTDKTIFLSHLPSVAPEMEAEAAKRMPLLAMYVNQHVLHVMQLIFALTLELDLFTQGELVPALWYWNFTQRAQIENLGLLAPPPAAMIPETRVNRRTKVPLYNLALTTRTSGHPDTVRLTMLEAGRMIADAVFVAACVLEAKGLIDLTSAAKHSLMTVENAFNHRMKCLQHIRSPPFTPYSHCIAAKLNISTSENLDSRKVFLYAQKAGEIAVSAADKLKQLMASKDLDQARKKTIQPQVENMERTARAVGASLAAFAAVSDNDEALQGYHVSAEYPFDPSMLCFTFRKK